MLPADGVRDPNCLRLEAAKQRTEHKLIQRLRHEIDADEHLKGWEPDLEGVYT